MMEKKKALVVEGQTEHLKHLFLVNGLAFTLGWSNVLCLIKYRTFGTMMTGNTLYFGQNLVLGKWVDAAYYGSVIVSFVTGSLLYKLVDWKSPKKRAATMLAPFCLAMTVTQDALVSEGRWPVMLVTCVLGVMTSVSNDYDGIVTNVVTSHIQKFTVKMFDNVVKPTSLDDKTKADMRTSGLVIAAFFSGVCFGTAVARLVNIPNRHPPFQPPVFTPLGIVFAGLLLLHDKHVGDLVLRESIRRKRRSLVLTDTRHRLSQSISRSRYKKNKRHPQDQPPQETTSSSPHAIAVVLLDDESHHHDGLEDDSEPDQQAEEEEIKDNQT